MNLKRYDILNALIKAHGYTSYLEIGVQTPENCFDKIDCAHKMGVDPAPNLKGYPAQYKTQFFVGTSDEAFAEMDKLQADVKADNIAGKFPHQVTKFDLIFIDGLHEAEQVKRDIANALRWISERGKIVLHDCLPTTELMQRVPRETKEWTGDVWKAIIAYRANPALDINVIDTDYGVGIICKCGSQNPIFVENPTFEQLQANKQEWLNLKTPEEFKAAYPL